MALLYMILERVSIQLSLLKWVLADFHNKGATIEKADCLFNLFKEFQDRVPGKKYLEWAGPHRSM